ncbi:apolipoprotein N-acyltransferase [Rhizomonospora bruguierae]|uniref:apolipoprotein N-acyltransferase n=1 Tax=Rhizomonospora bruguierae TaxID=1581705 RepID=UPI001BCB7648
MTTTVAPPAPTTAPSAPHRLKSLLGLVGAVASGGALLLAFPPYNLWWLAPVGVALLALAVHGRRARVGFGLGFVAGLALFLPLLSWTNLHTGRLPWVLLCLAEAAYLGLLGALTAFVGPVLRRAPAWPVVIGGLWVAQEALRDRTPFGGFPWGRLAFAQDGSPLLRLAAVGGAPLVTFGVAVLGGLLAYALTRLVAGRWRPALAALAAGVALTAAALLIPLGAPAGPTVTVAVVQGNVPRMGLDFNAQRRAVLDNHVNATIALGEDVGAGRRPQPDLVVWPENSSDIDPLRNPDAAARIDAAAAAVRAPILVGAVLVGPGEGQVRNAGILWRPAGGPDLEQLYVKRHPVPFAEYVPLRDLARMVSKEVDRVANDFVPGNEPGLIRAGRTTIGDVICFEVAYDEVVRDTVTGGADLLTVQTNNATFTVAEAEQQLAMVRLRAVEHRRSALMASTVGVSAFVTADGQVHDTTGFNEPATIVRQLPLDAGRALATRLGYWPEVVLCGLALAAVVAAGALRFRARR